MKKHLSSVSLFALMGSAIMLTGMSSAQAAVSVGGGTPGDCPDVFVFGQASAVTDAVSFNGSTYDYSYRVCNLSFGEGFNSGEGEFLIRDWEIPVFGEFNDDGDFIPEAGGIDLDSISSPDGWDWEIEEVGVGNEDTGWDGVAEWQDESDAWNIIFDAVYGEDDNPYDDNKYVLHWYVDPFIEDGCFFFDAYPCIAEGDDLEGFGFSADLGSVAAPFQTSWIELPANTGDPAVPGTGGGLPQTQSLRLPPTGVPEPGALGLLAGGLGLFGVMMRRRKNK